MSVSIRMEKMVLFIKTGYIWGSFLYFVNFLLIIIFREFGEKIKKLI